MALRLTFIEKSKDMLKLKESLVRIGQRSVSAFVLIMASTMMLFAQKTNEKFSMTTQMFLNELNEQAKQPAKSVLKDRKSVV